MLDPELPQKQMGSCLMKAMMKLIKVRYSCRQKTSEQINTKLVVVKVHACWKDDCGKE